MNAKKCKALRKQARAETEGLPAVAHKFPFPHLGYFVRDWTKGGVIVGYKAPHPQRLAACTRLTYKQLKKAS